MAAIYDPITGDIITDGLQGCNRCDEAMIMAKRGADRLGRDVHLHDDDGEWMVHPMIDGEREMATEIETEADDSDDDGEYSRWAGKTSPYGDA